MASISYVKVNWQDGESGGTPISAENLGKMDDAIANLTAQINANTTAIEQLSSGSSQLVEQVNSGIEEVKDMLDVIAEEGFADASNINYVAPVSAIKDTGSAMDYLFKSLESQLVFISYADYMVLTGQAPNPDGVYVDSSDPNAYYGVESDYVLIGIFHNKMNIMPSAEINDSAQRNGFIGKNLINPTCATKTVNGIVITNNNDGTYTIDASGNIGVFTKIKLGSCNFERGRKLKLCGAPSGSGVYSYLTIYKDGAEIAEEDEINDYGDGRIFEATDEDTIALCLSQYTKSSNIVIKPMVTTDLNATYDGFIKYVPSNWEIQNVVGKANSAFDALFS